MRDLKTGGRSLKYLGYLLLPVLWLLRLVLAIWVWQFRFIFGVFAGGNGGGRPIHEAIQSDTSYGQDLKFTLRDGFLDSYNAGSQFRIDGNGWVYEAGMVGRRVGRIDGDGLWRSETNEVIARFDDDGVLREHADGFMSGVFESQSGTGRELGRLG